MFFFSIFFSSLLLQKGKFVFFCTFFWSRVFFFFLKPFVVPVLVPFNHLFSLNSPNYFDGDDDDDYDDKDGNDDDDDLSPPRCYIKSSLTGPMVEFPGTESGPKPCTGKKKKM